MLGEARAAFGDAWRRLREQARQHRATRPPLNTLVDELHDALTDEAAVGVVVLGLRNLEEVEEAHGWLVADEALVLAAEAVADALDSVLPSGSSVASAGMFGEEVLAFVPLAAPTVAVAAPRLAAQAEELERLVV